MPIGRRFMPIGNRFMPIENRFMPIGTLSMPIGTLSMPIENRFMPIVWASNLIFSMAHALLARQHLQTRHKLFLGLLTCEISLYTEGGGCGLKKQK